MLNLHLLTWSPHSTPALWASASRALNCDCFISKLRRLDQGPLNLIIAVIVLLHPYLNLVNVPSAHPSVVYPTCFRFRKAVLDRPTESTDAVVICILQTSRINLASSFTAVEAQVGQLLKRRQAFQFRLFELVMVICVFRNVQVKDVVAQIIPVWPNWHQSRCHKLIVEVPDTHRGGKLSLSFKSIQRR